MNDLERLWRERNDGPLLEAVENLDDYTEEAKRVILAEMARRGLKVPEPESEQEEEAEEREEQANDEEPADIPGAPVRFNVFGQPKASATAVEVPVADTRSCVRCGLELEFLGSVELPGEHSGLLTALAQMLEGEQALAVYRCPECGHLDFYAEDQAAEEADEENS